MIPHQSVEEEVLPMTRMRNRLVYRVSLFMLLFTIPFLALTRWSMAEEALDPLDTNVLQLANECAEKVIKQFDLMLSSGTLTVGQLFDTFYIPIPQTTPQKYHTQYDKLTDQSLRPILDACQKKNNHIISVVVVDRNGYLPTHNTNFTQPLTGDAEIDAKRNRSKRLFNDSTGLAAARNNKPYLLQKYDQDTGEKMRDLSVPLQINGQHWGAIRVAYN